MPHRIRTDTQIAHASVMAVAWWTLFLVPVVLYSWLSGKPLDLGRDRFLFAITARQPVRCTLRRREVSDLPLVRKAGYTSNRTFVRTASCNDGTGDT